MARARPPELLGIHTNMAGVVPPEIDKAGPGRRPGAGRSLGRREASRTSSCSSSMQGRRLRLQMGSRPQTLYGMADSPVGLAAFFLDHDARSLELIARAFDGQPEGLTRDDVLDNITLTWLTNTAVSAAPSLLGEQVRLLRRQGRHHPGCRERLPRRALSGPAELGGAGLSQAHPLQQARQGRPLRGLGAAGALRATSCARGSSRCASGAWSTVGSPMPRRAISAAPCSASRTRPAPSTSRST